MRIRASGENSGWESLGIVRGCGVIMRERPVFVFERLLGLALGRDKIAPASLEK